MEEISDSDSSSTSKKYEDIENDEQCLYEANNLNPEKESTINEEHELKEDSLEGDDDTRPTSTSARNEEERSADMSHIDFQQSLDIGNRKSNKEKLEGENTGDEASIRPNNEKLKQEYESPASAGKMETSPHQEFASGDEALRLQCTSHTLKKTNMEKRDDDNRTRGHELYLKYILLLLQAAQVALKGFLCKMVKYHNGNLADLITERKDTFKNSHREEFHLLFKDDRVNKDIESWDTRSLCVVILVLFHSGFDLQRTEYESSVKCILDQRNDLDNYVQSASLNFNTFETNWKILHDAVIELIKYIDNNAEFECIRIIHSYEPGSIIISQEVIRNLKKTHDVKMHVKIASQNKVDLEHGKQRQDKDQPEKRHTDNIKFTERLQDKFVYVDDAAVLTCKLNVSEGNVTWRHDYKHIKYSDTMKKLTDGCCHWLAISCATLEDAGCYACACCNASTTAYLRVAEKPLKMTEELHIATEETNVRENMDIVLVCKVNQHTSNVTWRHKGEGINSKRHHIFMDDNVHKLTILKAQYEDEGEYTVDFGTTRFITEVILKGNLPAHRAQLANDLFKNWIKGALGLKYLKLGLEDVSCSIVKKHHSELLAQLSCIKMTCTQCTTDQLLPAHPQQQCPNRTQCICSKQPKKRAPCPNGGFCSKFFDLVLFDHRTKELLLANTDLQKWANDPWSVAKCYIQTRGYHDKSSEKKIDCVGLLSLFINNTFFERNLKIEVNGETDVFKKAKDTRHDILHNANYELSKGQLNNYLDLFTSVLEVKDVNGKHPLQCYPVTKQ